MNDDFVYMLIIWGKSYGRQTVLFYSEEYEAKAEAEHIDTEYARWAIVELPVRERS